MISISRHIDEFDIAREVRLERQVHRGSFLLVEGDTDIKRFANFTDEKECSFVNCYGKKNVVEAIKLLYEDGFPGALGAVDADFDRIEACLEEHEGLVYSGSHDFDLDWARPNVVEKYLSQVADAEKWRSHGPADQLIDRLLEGLKPVSVARLLNHRGRIRYKLTEIDVATCFADFAVDVEGYVDLIFTQRSPTDQIRNALKDQIVRASHQLYDLRQLTNGHDFHCALGACLRSELASRRVPQTWASEIELHLRLAFTDEEFKSSELYKQILAWIGENAPYRILHPRLL
jgi:hypothetical protein